LLADEIAVAIHSLASVNIGWFFGHFLPTFLATCEGVDDMQRATLLGNFDKSTVHLIFSIFLNIKIYNTLAIKQNKLFFLFLGSTNFDKISSSAYFRLKMLSTVQTGLKGAY